jgi:hypothetical protein
MNNDECCPQFDSEFWDGKVIEWENKKFIKDKVLTLFHIPINFGRVITRLTQKIENAQASMPDYLCLSDHTSRWNMNLYVAVDKNIPNVENVTFSGKFLSKVYEGPYKDTGKWCDDFQNYAIEQGFDIQKWYMWYTTCPKCAKKYGKNYVVIVGQVD